jgi:hemerythrin superfamily protein
MSLLSRKSRTDDVSDPTKLLVLDHQKVERLFEQIEEADEPNLRQGLVAQLTFELERHTEIEERIVYPFIREHVPGGAEMVDHAEDEHGEAKAVLAEVSTLDVDTPDFPKKLKQLKKLVQGHVKEEEKAVLPKLDDSVDAPALNRLRGDLERAKLATTPSPSLPDESAPTGTAERVSSGSAGAAAVLVRKRDDGKWEVRRENASRATKLFTTKKEAERFGRDVARNQDAPLEVS